MCIRLEGTLLAPTLEFSMARLTNCDDQCSQRDLQQSYFKFIHDDESGINGSRHIGTARGFSKYRAQKPAQSQNTLKKGFIEMLPQCQEIHVDWPQWKWRKVEQYVV